MRLYNYIIKVYSKKKMGIEMNQKEEKEWNYVWSNVISIVLEGISFFSILIHIGINMFQCTVSNLSIFFKKVKYMYIYMKNIKMRLNVIHLD